MFLLINKPPGPTSHDVVNQLRRITQIKKIGHAGTLDPFAQGLLIAAIGRASTKQLHQFLKLDKTYLAAIKLGAVSDTYDKTGLIQQTTNNKQLTTKQINLILKKFIGLQLQTPPPYSAKKINGQKAYVLARKGLAPKLNPKKINIYNIELNKILITNYYLLITVHCSSGTYIRSLAHDLGQKLGTGAYLEKLTRAAIGPFQLQNAVRLDQLTPLNWREFILPDLSHSPDLPRMTRVLVFGTFDRLHPGHLNFFQQAKKLDRELYVIVARDQNVRQIKRQAPQQNELVRLKNIKLQTAVTDAHLGQANFQHRFHIINKIKPDIIALGYDQPVDLKKLKDKIKHYNLTTKIIRLKPFQPGKYKSSKINKQLTTNN